MSQNGREASPLKPGHSESMSQIAAHNPLAEQYGAPASHSAEVEHVSAMHVLPRQIKPSPQSGSTVHAFGFLSVQDPATTNVKTMLRMLPM